MRLSDDKVSDIAFKLADRLETDDRIRFSAPKNVVRACINRTITAELQLEDRVIQEVLAKIDAMKSLKPNSPKWEGHFERLYQQEMDKRGRHWEISAREVLR